MDDSGQLWYSSLGSLAHAQNCDRRWLWPERPMGRGAEGRPEEGLVLEADESSGYSLWVPDFSSGGEAGLGIRWAP